MQCDDVIRLLPDMLYNEIDAQSREQVSEHLVTCASCWAEYESFKRTVQVLDQWPPTEAPADTAELARLLEGTASRPTPRHWILRRPVLSGLAAGLILFLGLLALNVHVSAHDGGLILSIGRRPVVATTDANLLTQQATDNPDLIRYVDDRVEHSASLAGEALVEYIHDWTVAQEQRQLELFTLMNQLRQQDVGQVTMRLNALEETGILARQPGSSVKNPSMPYGQPDRQRTMPDWQPGRVVIDNHVYQAVYNEQTGQFELQKLTFQEDSEMYQ
ncbi:MAG: zf-HC2 domain-containing protein [Planctomycetes bacterium]|nr:zf-HC2 domain-containing protein [Planctomycetota bacterium]